MLGTNGYFEIVRFNPGFAKFAQENCFDGALLQSMCTTVLDILSGNNPIKNTVNNRFTLKCIMNFILSFSISIQLFIIYSDIVACHIRTLSRRSVYETSLSLWSIDPIRTIPTIRLRKCLRKHEILYEAYASQIQPWQNHCSGRLSLFRKRFIRFHGGH